MDQEFLMMKRAWAIRFGVLLERGQKMSEPVDDVFFVFLYSMQGQGLECVKVIYWCARKLCMLICQLFLTLRQGNMMVI